MSRYCNRCGIPHVEGKCMRDKKINGVAPQQDPPAARLARYIESLLAKLKEMDDL